MLLSAELKHRKNTSTGYYLPGYLCRSGPEAEAGRCVLLLLHAFHTGTEVKLHVEAFLRGQILLGGTAILEIRSFCAFLQI